MLIFFVICIFLITGALWKVRIHIKWESVGTVILIGLKLRLFYGVFPLHIAKGFDLRDTVPFLARMEIRMLSRGITEKKSGKKREYLRAFHAQRIKCALCIGFHDNAHCTALVAGIIRILFFILKDVADCQFDGYSEPDFAKPAFRIKLEGIIDFYPKQIILATIKRQVTKIRGKKYAASD